MIAFENSNQVDRRFDAYPTRIGLEGSTTYEVRLSASIALSFVIPGGCKWKTDDLAVKNSPQCFLPERSMAININGRYVANVKLVSEAHNVGAGNKNMESYWST